MVIQQTPRFQPPARLGSLPSLTTQSKPEASGDQVEIKNQQPPTPPEQPNNNVGAKALGAFVGSVAGIAAGYLGGPAGVAAAAGLGAAAVTFAAAAPLFQESLESGQTGNLFQDVILTCGTFAAGGMLLATTSAAAAGLAFPAAAGLGMLSSHAAPLLGGAIGAAVGGYLVKDN